MYAQVSTIYSMYNYNHNFSYTVCAANFSGRVVTAEDRTALSGVWIQLIGTNRACLTDIEGYFSLIYDTESGYESDSKGGSEAVSKAERYRDSNSNFNPDSLFKLRISYLGRQTKVVIAQDSFMLIELDLSTTELREFVKIAYGLSAAKTLTWLRVSTTGFSS